MMKLALVLMFSAGLCFLSSTAIADTNRGEVRSSIENQHEGVIWSKEIDHSEYAKLLVVIPNPGSWPAFLTELCSSILKETGGEVAKSTIVDLLLGKRDSVLAGGKTVYVRIATYGHFKVVDYPKMDKYKLKKGKLRVRLPNTHQLYVAIGKVKAEKVVKADELPARFREIGAWGSRNGFETGFPNFETAVYEKREVYGAFFFRANVAEWRDIPVVELGGENIKTPDGRFRAVNRWAESNGFRCGFPNFHEAEYDGLNVIGAWLFRDEYVEWRDLPAKDIGKPKSFEATIRGVSAWASSHGYSTAFPNGHHAFVDGQQVYGTFLVKKGIAVHRDVPVDELIK